MQELLKLLVDPDMLDALKLAFVGAFNLNKNFPNEENYIALKKGEDSYMTYIETHANENETSKYKSIKSMYYPLK